MSEVVWMQKIKSSRDDYELLLNDYSTLERLMDIYGEQFRSVKQLIGVENVTDQHPYPFSELVIKLSKRCEDVNRNMMVLKDQMSTLKCNLKSQTERAETFSQTANKLSVDSKKSNDIIDNNHDELKKLKGKIQGLEKELVSKDFKLSKIVGAYQQMMQ
jgi:hypothetical protein